MNNEEFIAYHKQFCDKMHETVIKKNHDYVSRTEEVSDDYNISNV